MFLSKKYPYVKQTDKNDCGPACLASVLKYYGFKTSVSKLRELTKTDINGTTIFGIIKAAESLNMIAKAVKAKSLDVLKTDFPKPAIAYVIYEDGMRHYVVLYEVNEKEVILADTGKGIVKYKIDEFFKIWTGNLILMDDMSVIRYKIIAVTLYGNQHQHDNAKTQNGVQRLTAFPVNHLRCDITHHQRNY